jgi:enolase
LLLLLLVLHSASSFSEALRMGAEVYHNLKNLIKDKYGE